MLCLGHAPVGPEGGHAAGRALLKTLYEAHTGEPLPPIRLLPGGKPVLEGSSLHFSISHTPHHVFCALSRTPIGIDAEELGRRPRLELAQKILSAGEYARWRAAEDPHAALLRLWVLKEAAAKKTGQGIRGYPNQTDFDPNDPSIRCLYGCFVAIAE